MLICTSIHEILRQRFGLSEFRPKQLEVIDNVLQGKHTLALLPTGYGKSLCYQVPSQLLDGVTIVVSPLIALMQDQVSGLIRRGITNVTLLNSSLQYDERDQRMADIRNGMYKLIYVAPERFESASFRRLLSSLNVALIVIDEAHCISQWGHDFRPHYRNLSNYLSHFPAARILALTATATGVVQRDIVQSLALPQMQVVVGSFDRPNLHLEVRQFDGSYEKDSYLFQLLRGKNEPAIVYTNSRKETEQLSGRLKENGIHSAFYHAGLSQADRQRIQHNFEQEQPPVIVCTVAFGMGIDKSNVRRVVHFNMPGSLESYYQEAGRAGRDGAEATCTLLYQPRDIHTQRFLMDKNYPKADQVQAVLHHVIRNAPNTVRAVELLQSVEIDNSALNSALDLLKHTGRVAQMPDGGVCAAPLFADSAGVDMSWLNNRRQRDESRLQAMIDYAQSNRCRRREILRYFGQALENKCTGCDICTPQLFHYETANVRRFQSPQSMSKSTTSWETKNSIKREKPVVAIYSAKESGALEATILCVVGELSGRVGRTTIALILLGSKSKKIVEKGLHHIESYGKYRGYNEDGLLGCIDRLVEEGAIKVTSGLYPKVLITESGKQRLGQG
ncbi:MAG TPA: ATP-dependent DNA helicase RecQ [Planktothrix sp.]|jgi:ATP-dependent DNA helicase RecQ